MKKKGFTVIELVVSIAIISMVTAIFLVNYRTVNRRSDLTMISQKVVTDIRMAQNYSLGLARYGENGSTNIPVETEAETKNEGFEDNITGQSNKYFISHGNVY
ncbi:MAG: prepilin-type N-terminal cleavage/methylation domain-containing protein [Bacteroidetes bacterium]|nr:prepilin-type N-terminal cleavage/methylation domain-containing protein [Bacteroidota bacterium]